MKLRVGLVGLGPSWRSRHLPALGALSSRFEVRAVCDPVAHRASLVASELGARPCDGFRTLTTAEDVDAVMMLSGRWFGALPIHAACDAGKAIYCGASVEAPFNEALRLRDRVREAGVAFMAELPNRFAPATLRLKELIATRLGAPRLVFCNERHAAPSPSGKPFASHTRRLIEMVDWCRYVVGSEASSVMGVRHTAHDTIESDDYSLVTIDFEPNTPEREDRPIAQIACGGYVPTGWGEAAAFRRAADLQVVCERGIAFLDLPASLVWFDDAGQHTESLEQDRPIGERLLMQFYRSVESLVLRPSSLDDAFQAISIVSAARASSERGQRIGLQRQ